MFANDFRFLVEGVPKPSDIADAMSPRRSKGYFSIIQPDYITECIITTSSDETAQGRATFNAPKLYIGTAAFDARKHQGKWRIEKFLLPSRQISIVLGKDGIWQRTAEGSGENDISDHSTSMLQKSAATSGAADNELMPFVRGLQNSHSNAGQPQNVPGDVIEVDLPKQALAPDITSLVCVELQAVTPESIDQSFARLLDATSSQKKEWATEWIGKQQEQVRPALSALTKGIESGLEVLLMAEQTAPANAVAADIKDALDVVADAQTLIDGGATPDELNSRTVEDRESQPGQLFIRMRPGTRPENAIESIVASLMKETHAAADAEVVHALEAVKAVNVVDIGDGWFAAKGEHVLPLPATEQALDIKPFVNAMQNYQNAPIRFAWLMNEGTRAEFNQAQLDAGALAFGSLQTSLREMQSTSGGLWFGREPKGCA